MSVMTGRGKWAHHVRLLPCCCSCSWWLWLRANKTKISAALWAHKFQEGLFTLHHNTRPSVKSNKLYTFTVSNISDPANVERVLSVTMLLVLNTDGCVTFAVKCFVFSHANCETGNYTFTSRCMVKVKTSMVTGLLSGTPNTGWNSVPHFVIMHLLLPN